MSRVLTFLLLVVLALAGGGALVAGVPGAPGDPSPTGTATGPGPSAPVGSADPATCRRADRTVEVGLSRTRYPEVRRHWERAIARGWPRTLTVRRRGAAGRRTRLLRGIATAPGKDRDEYPMAMARTGVAADVALVDSGQNRGAGAVQGVKLRRWCSGQRFRIVWY